MDVAATALHFDADALLRPIPGDGPTGESLRYEGTYDAIAGLRREDDPQLEQGAWKTDLKKADWPHVAQTCLQAIETRSKDVQIAAWLLEAWLHLHGFVGVREGLRVIAELCDTYWDGLHPEIVDGDLEYRLAPIEWIDEKLTIAVRLIPITHPEAEELAPYSLADWEFACRHPARPRDQRPDQLTDVQFRKSAAATPRAWLARIGDEALGAQRAVDDLVNLLTARCGEAAPRLSRMRGALAAVVHLVAMLLEHRGMPLAPPLAAAPREVDDAVPRDAPANAAPPIRSRAEAYQRLAEAAEFLTRTEPHSPVPHLIRRAISWGGLSLEELLPELVRDSAQLSEIYRTLQLGEKL
jgi:type VI secretion system ImpA family protein